MSYIIYIYIYISYIYISYIYIYLIYIYLISYIQLYIYVYIYSRCILRVSPLKIKSLTIHKSLKGRLPGGTLPLLRGVFFGGGS